MEPSLEPSKDNDDDADDVVRWKIYLVLGFFIMLAMGFSIVMALNDLSETAGQFGDSFGWITAIFSSLASAGAVYAVFLQTKELNESRKESKKSARDRSQVTNLRACIVLIPDIKERRTKVENRIAELMAEREALATKLGLVEITKMMYGEKHPQVAKIDDEIDAANRHYNSLGQRLDIARDEIDSYLTKMAVERGIELDPLDD